MKRLFAGTVLCLMMAGAAVAEEPFFSGSFDEACKLAREKGKIVMVDFYTTWCGPCRMLDRHTWPDQKVRQWLADKTIPIKVDADRNRNLAARFHVRSYPTIVFLTPDGEEIGRTRGFQQPLAFITNADKVLEGSRMKTALKPVPKPSPNPAQEAPPTQAKTAPVVSANDAILERTNRARQLAASERYEEALSELLWCFDQGSREAGPFRLRLTVVLAEIAKLGRVYEPAAQAMRTRRDLRQRMLMAGASESVPVDQRMPLSDLVAMANELAALNAAMEEPQRNLAMFHHLGKQGTVGKELQQALFDDLLDFLLASRSYQDIVNCAGDINGRIDRKIQRCQQLAGSSAGVSDKSRDDLTHYLRQQVALEGGKFYEALLAVGRPEDARKLAERILEFDPAPSVYASFVSHAVKAQSFDAARELVDRAEHRLKETDMTLVRRAAASIPRS